METIASNGYEIERAAVRAELARTLPDYLVPAAIVFFFAQRHLVAGLTAGGTKG